MSFAKRFNIKTSLEQIEEEQTDEQNTVATNEAPVETSTTAVDETAVDTTNAEPAAAEGEGTIDTTIVGDVEQPTGSVDVEGASVVVDNQDQNDAEVEFYNQEITSGEESVAALEALQAAVEKASEAKLAQEAYEQFVKIGVEAICKKHSISKESKHYPALENIAEDLKNFSSKLNIGIEAIKAKLEQVKTKK